MAGESTCGTCQPTATDGYLITRNWNIISNNWTDQDVIDEFQNGFAPEVTRMDGFRRYTAAKTGNASTVFFMNIFDTIEHATAAQEAAKTFVTEGNLQGNISPNKFTQDRIVAHFNIEECVSTSSVGRYLATRLNTLLSPQLFSAENETSDMADANDMFVNITGYHSFLASVGTNQSFYINMYDTEEGALNANVDVMNLNAENNYVMGQIYPTVGEIMFDYLCAARKENVSDGPTGGGPDVYDDGASSSTFLGICLYYAIAVMTPMLFLFN